MKIVRTWSLATLCGALTFRESKKESFSYYDGNSENKYKLKNKIQTL